MKIAVATSAGFDDAARLKTELDKFIKDIDDGGDPRVDLFFSYKHVKLRHAMQWLSRKVANWYRYPLTAPGVTVLRRKLLEAAPNILFMWDGKSAGTQKLIDMAEKEGKNFRLVMY